MSDKKHSADATEVAPVLTDLLLMLNGTPENRNVAISVLKTLIQSTVQLDAITGSPAWSAGQLSFDPITGTLLADTKFDGVRVNVGQEIYIPFYNGTAGEIAGGTPVNATGVDLTNNVVEGEILSAASPITSSAFIGLATHAVPAGTVGFATALGYVNGINTGGLDEGGVLYAGGAGALTNDWQVYPARVVVVGTCVYAHASDGVVLVKATDSFTRGTGSKSYAFTQANIGSGDYYVGGFYKAPLTDANLDQGTTEIVYGAANAPYEAHAFAVFAAAGTVNTGVVGIRVNGNSLDTATGIVSEDDSEVLIADITNVSTNQYLETSKKWVGQVTFELYIVSGTPTAYSLDFNYGYAKYEDLGNNDFTVTGFEVVGVAGANDTAFNIELLHHQGTGWVYDASAFEPGDGSIVELSDQDPYDVLTNGDPFAFKRPNLNAFINGDSDEGIIVRVSCGQQNSVTSMNIHLTGVIEELVY